MAAQTGAVRPVVTAGEALRGLLAFLALVASVAGLAAALLVYGGPPAAPASWPSLAEVRDVLLGTELPAEPVVYGATMVGWLLLGYLVAVTLLQAVVQAVAALWRGTAFAAALAVLADAVTVPWVKKGVGGGMAAFVFLSVAVKAPHPDLPALGGPAGAEAQAAHQVVLTQEAVPVPTFEMTFTHPAPAAVQEEVTAPAPVEEHAAAPEEAPVPVEEGAAAPAQRHAGAAPVAADEAPAPMPGGLQPAGPGAGVQGFDGGGVRGFDGGGPGTAGPEMEVQKGMRGVSG